MTEPTYRTWNEDCVAGMAEHLNEGEVNLSVTSIPFGALFSYSGKTEDIGNNTDGVDMRAGQFGLHLRFFAEQLYRVMEPGGVVCIHIQQLIATKVQHGFMGRRDLRAATVDVICAAGFDWTGEFAIPKNPQVIAQRQKLHSLMFVSGKRDGRLLAPAVNDFVMVFRKPGEGTPVPCIWDGAANPSGWVTTEEWIRDAHGVWSDIRETDVLTGWQMARESDSEKHVCPLQLEVIRRCVRLYSNPGGLVLDPFSGIASTGWVAIEQGRNYVGFELKESYFGLGNRNLDDALEKRRQRQQELPLFAGMPLEAAS